MRTGLRKCVCTVIFKSDMGKRSDYQIYKITVNHKGRLIDLLNYDVNLLDYESFQKAEPYKYKTFDGMYSAVLNTLKYNNFYVGYYDDFGQRWYDIEWINAYDWEIDKYGKSLTRDE